MNTCLQCLISIPEFNYFFMAKNYQKEKMSKISLDACDAMHDYMYYYANCLNSYMKAPKTVFNICHSFLTRNQQHDSHV